MRDFFCQIKVSIEHYNIRLSARIKYGVHDLLYDVSNYA